MNPQVYLIPADIAARKNEGAGVIEGLSNYLKYTTNAVDANQVCSQLQ
jgi:hypothetical protein